MCKVNKIHLNLQQTRSDHPKLIFCSNGCKKTSDTKAADTTKNDTKQKGTNKRILCLRHVMKISLHDCLFYV